MAEVSRNGAKKKNGQHFPRGPPLRKKKMMLVSMNKMTAGRTDGRADGRTEIEEGAGIIHVGKESSS
jgi:hypothetical protein